MRILNALGVVFVAAVCLLGGYLFGQYRTRAEMGSLVLQADKYRIVRTQGGELLVGKLVKPESMAWQVTWDCYILPAAFCKLFGGGIAQISGEVHYSYKVPLSGFWVLERVDGRVATEPPKYLLKVPSPRADFPVAVDLSSIKVNYQGKLMAPSPPDQPVLQKRMQPEMNNRANAATYLHAIDSDAKKTVEEFARKWMRDGDFKIPEGAAIEVEFTSK